MTTALDTNIIVGLWDESDDLNEIANLALNTASDNGALIVSGLVYAELLALPTRTERMLDEFLRANYVSVDWDISERMLRSAGLGFQRYAARRRKSAATHPRRILADFLIGAHAFTNGYTLLTLDQRHYRIAFPKLKLQSI